MRRNADWSDDLRARTKNATRRYPTGLQVSYGHISKLGLLMAVELDTKTIVSSKPAKPGGTPSPCITLSKDPQHPLCCGAPWR